MEEKKRISIDEWLSYLGRIGRPINNGFLPSGPIVQDEKEAYKIIYERTAYYCEHTGYTALTYFDVMVAIRGLGLEAKNLLKSSDPTEVEYAKKTLTFLEDFITAFDGRLEEVHFPNGNIAYISCRLYLPDSPRMFNKGAKIIFKAFDQRFKARYKKEVAEKKEQKKRELAEQKEQKLSFKKKNKTFIDKYRNK